MSEIFANHDFLLRGELCWAKIKVIKEQQIYVSFSYCHLKALCCTFVFFCDDETECLFVFVKMSIIALSILQIEHQVLFAVVRTLLEQMCRYVLKNDIAYLVCWVDWQYMTGLLHEGIFHVQGLCEPAIFDSSPWAYVMCKRAQILICGRHWPSQ